MQFDFRRGYRMDILVEGKTFSNSEIETQAHYFSENFKDVIHLGSATEMIKGNGLITIDGTMIGWIHKGSGH